MAFIWRIQKLPSLFIRSFRYRVARIEDQTQSIFLDHDFANVEVIRLMGFATGLKWYGDDAVMFGQMEKAFRQRPVSSL